MGFWDRFPLVSPSQMYCTPAAKSYPTAQMPQPIPARFKNERRQTWYSLTQRSVYWVSSFLQIKGGRKGLYWCCNQHCNSNRCRKRSKCQWSKRDVGLKWAPPSGGSAGTCAGPAKPHPLTCILTRQLLTFDITSIKAHLWVWFTTVY